MAEDLDLDALEAGLETTVDSISPEPEPEPDDAGSSAPATSAPATSGGGGGGGEDDEDDDLAGLEAALEIEPEPLAPIVAAEATAAAPVPAEAGTAAQGYEDGSDNEIISSDDSSDGVSSDSDSSDDSSDGDDGGGDADGGGEPAAAAPSTGEASSQPSASSLNESGATEHGDGGGGTAGGWSRKLKPQEYVEANCKAIPKELRPKDATKGWEAPFLGTIHTNLDAVGKSLKAVIDARVLLAENLLDFVDVEKNDTVRAHCEPRRHGSVCVCVCVCVCLLGGARRSRAVLGATTRLSPRRAGLVSFRPVTGFAGARHTKRARGEAGGSLQRVWPQHKVWPQHRTQNF
eukprot:SAG22_NODE_2220_length_2822_cov_1.945648_2_plen_347_part_00